MRREKPWFMEPLDFWIPAYAFGVIAMFLIAGVLATYYNAVVLGACPT